MEAVIALFIYSALFVLFLAAFGLLVWFLLIVADSIRRYKHVRLLRSYGVPLTVAEVCAEMVSAGWNLKAAKRLEDYPNVPSDVVERVTGY